MIQADELKQSDVPVWVVDAAALAGQHAQLSALLNDDDLKRLQRYTNQAARDMFLASRAALRLLLGRYLGLQPQQVSIATHDHGKPFLPEYPHLHFNISHSRTLALIAFALAPVGVDVEYLPRSVDFAAVMRRFFSEEERADWSANSVPSQQHAFFRGWTRKEAILKATGEGIAGLGHTRISFKPEHPRALIARQNDPEQPGKWFFCDFCPAPDYQAAVALQASSLQLTLRQFSLK